MQHRRLAAVGLVIVGIGAVAAMSGNAVADTLFVVAVAPALYIVWHFHHADKYKAESFGLLLGTFLLGCIAAAIAAVIEPQTPSTGGFWTMFLFFLVSVAFIEELVKFAAVRLFAYRSAKFDEAMDGVIFGITAAMGFAAVENVGYVFQFGGGIAIFRAFVSVPGHAFYGAIIGYYLGESKVHRNPWLVVWGLAIAIALHAVFDTLAQTSGLFALILLPALVWFIYFAIVRREIAKAQSESLYRPA
jgi:RsiW-degrading membrane proteinase PrsW (M82 family)